LIFTLKTSIKSMKNKRIFRRFIPTTHLFQQVKTPFRRCSISTTLHIAFANSPLFKGPYFFSKISSKTFSDKCTCLYNQKILFLIGSEKNLSFYLFHPTAKRNIGQAKKNTPYRSNERIKNIKTFYFSF